MPDEKPLVNPARRVYDAVTQDDDVKLGAQILKRNFISVFVGATSLVISLGAAYLVEVWVHFLIDEMALHKIGIAHWAKIAIPWVSGAFALGICAVASIAAIKEMWQIMSGEKAHKSPPHKPNRAERRAQTRRR